MSSPNKPKMSISERMGKIAEIQDKYGLENLVDIVMELTENPEIELADLGPKMRYAVLQVLLIDAPPHDRPSGIREHIDLLLNIRRRKMGLPLSKTDEEVGETAENIRKRIMPTMPGYKPNEPAIKVRHETLPGYRRK